MLQQFKPTSATQTFHISVPVQILAIVLRSDLLMSLGKQQSRADQDGLQAGPVQVIVTIWGGNQ